MNLILNLKREYFEQIKVGIKTEEYRLKNDYWTKRLVNKNYDNLIICLGYPNKNDKEKRLEFPYRGYTIKTITHSHFGKNPVNVFAIALK